MSTVRAYTLDPGDVAWLGHREHDHNWRLVSDIECRGSTVVIWTIDDEKFVIERDEMVRLG